MQTLKEIFDTEDIVPVPDRKVKWLRMHRPSAAMLLCLCSGPWKLGRRQTVQANALKILGIKDLSQLTTRDIIMMSPLDWQVRYLTAARNTVKIFGSTFDDMFDILKSDTKAQRQSQVDLVTEIHYRAHGYYFPGARGGSSFKKPLPKVLGMFVRDFLFVESFPIDRHVRKWLKDHKLPTKQDQLLKMFRDGKLQARGYARALFNAKSENPIHPTTKSQRKS